MARKPKTPRQIQEERLNGMSGLAETMKDELEEAVSKLDELREKLRLPTGFKKAYRRAANLLNEAQWAFECLHVDVEERLDPTPRGQRGRNGRRRR